MSLQDILNSQHVTQILLMWATPDYGLVSLSPQAETSHFIRNVLHQVGLLFAFRTSLILHVINSLKGWKCSSEVWSIFTSCSCCRLIRWTSRKSVFCSTTSQRSSLMALESSDSEKVMCWWICVNCGLSFQFLADRSDTRCCLLLLWSTCFKAGHVLQTLVWLFDVLPPFCHLQLVSPFSSDISRTFVHTAAARWIVYFLNNSLQTSRWLCLNNAGDQRFLTYSDQMIMLHPLLPPSWCPVWTSAGHLHHWNN